MASRTSEGGLISKIWKEFKWLNGKKIAQLQKNEDLSRHLSKEDIKMSQLIWENLQHQ
jgi:hypothetical protein